MRASRRGRAIRRARLCDLTTRDERLFVVERKGRIWVLVNGRRLPRPSSTSRTASRSSASRRPPVARVRPRLRDRPGLFYVDYTDLRASDRRRGVSRALGIRTSPTPRRRAAFSSFQTRRSRHHGGLVLFGPDGRLWIGQGDGGDSSSTHFPAQELDNLHGKILRIDPRPHGDRPYRIPSGQPLRRASGTRRDLGLRPTEPLALRIRPDERGARHRRRRAAESPRRSTSPRAQGSTSGGVASRERHPMRLGVNGPPSCNDIVSPAIELVRGAAPVQRAEPRLPTSTRGRPRRRPAPRRPANPCAASSRVSRSRPGADRPRRPPSVRRLL